MSWMKHTFVMGLPRTGKTTLCAKMFADIPHSSIFINTQWEDFDLLAQNGGFSIPEYVVIWEYRNGLYSRKFPKGKIIYNIQDEGPINSLLVDIFAYQRKQRSLKPITIFIDEAHIYFPRDYNIDALQNVHMKNIMTRGSKFNIRLILISQKPQLVCPKIYTLCEQMIVFKLHPNDYTYFKRHGINLERVDEHYKFVILD